jgi:hypothetical protein
MTRVPHRILVLVSLLVAAFASVRFGASLASGNVETKVLFDVGGMTVFTIVGALIEDRRPANVVGRLCLATGLALVASSVLRVLAESLDSQPDALPPVGALAAVLSELTGILAIFAGGLVVVSRFPEGRLPGPLGRTTDAFIVLAGFLYALQVLHSDWIEVGSIGAVPNPIGFLVLPSQLVAAISGGGFLIYGAGFLGGLAGLVVRYRAGSPVARAQIRWLLAAIGTSGALLGLVLSIGRAPEYAWVWTAWYLSFLLPPIAIGIAILRYRLYEIDRIISRTIGYAVVTAVLAAVFLTTNLSLQTWVATITGGGGTVTVAASTLLVASLFQPLRRRIQRPIDLRFNRAQVDGERTLAVFGDRVREEVDLANLSGAVLVTANEAVRPAAAGLWLRGAAE